MWKKNGTAIPAHSTGCRKNEEIHDGAGSSPMIARGTCARGNWSRSASIHRLRNAIENESMMRYKPAARTHQIASGRTQGSHGIRAPRGLPVKNHVTTSFPCGVIQCGMLLPWSIFHSFTGVA
ncbi:MAG: hypothetical protein BWY06_00163 [Candidatus Latescibacteria bacterium ADurb.Bin168]|nr:MAG: hypothetical protein BWY06_00163 [Candidatus Latescibacteria bacterium ADurb.Bin168]